MMKYTFTFLLTLVLTLLTTIAFGQVEQWIEQAKKVTGKEQVDLYNKIAEYYTFESEPFSAKTYAQKAIEMATSMDYYNGLAVGYFYLAEAYNLSDDLKSAEKTYKKWYKTRKKRGNKEQLNWATIGMARFYQSQEHDRKTECYFKKALKKTKEGSYREFSILQALADYYQHGKNYRTDRELNLKKATKYFERMTESGRKVYGKDFGTGNLDNYFSTELVKALENKQGNLANKIAQQWLKSKAKFVNQEVLYRTSRQITRYFYDRQYYNYVVSYLDKSVFYAKENGENKWIKSSLDNAIYITRHTKQFEEAFRYGFDLLKYEQYPKFVISALNTCTTEMLKEKSIPRIQNTIKQITAWQKTLNQNEDKIAYNWTVETLAFLKTKI